MALASINIAIGSVATGASEVRTSNAAGGVPFPDLTDITSHAASLATHIATAVGIGAGDAHVSVALASTDSGNITTDIAALVSGMTGSVTLVYDPAVLTTKNQGKAVLDAIAARLRAVGLL